jgi:aryl-alcohol dehydrogenase-like predicted oxidoreductase
VLYRELGRTGLKVSVIALGTMTWGEQNSEAEGHAQIDAALAAGVNFIDTAEMYPVPPKADTYGRTEAIIGTWLKQSGRRERIVLASKAAGPAHTPARPQHVRGNRTRFTAVNLEEALHDSLRRLQTDYLDLYQLHWPDRSTNIFGQLGYQHQSDEAMTPIHETLTALSAFVKAGKIRYIGLSNESPWGICEFLKLAQQHGLERVVSVQNPYSLVNRTYEIGHAEISMREQTGLLAYSPLAFGVLSGKYLGGALPAQARITLFERFARYKGENTERAVYEYVKLFRQHGIDPAQGALAFVNSRPFVTSTIIGATTLEQLQSNLASIELVLPETVLEGIERIHERYPNPAP